VSQLHCLKVHLPLLRLRRWMKLPLLWLVLQ
jgi:hypothetical protein